MPHARFSELTRGHFILMQREYMAINRQLLNTNWHSKEGPPLRQAEREINEASGHASRMEGDIEYILDLLTDTVTPSKQEMVCAVCGQNRSQEVKVTSAAVSIGWIRRCWIDHHRRRHLE